MQTPVLYAELNDLLRRLGSAEDAAGYHGALCGSLCVKRTEEIDLLRLVDVGEDEGLTPEPGARRLLEQLREQALTALQDSDMIFQPLLPEDDAPLPARVQALAAWCQGFLFGLASRPKLDLKSISEDAREILRDFTQFSQATAENDDGEVEENAYTELVEYIRVGAQLVFMELRRPPTPDPNQPTQLH